MVNATRIQKEKIKAGRLSVVVGLFVFAAKIIALILTGSAAVYSDAAESVVHILATIMALFSLYYAAKPPDKNHLYGHGNIEYFSAGMEGLLIIIAAITIFYEAIKRMIYGGELENLGSAIIIIIGIVLVNLILGLYLVKKGKKTNSLILIADGKHILTDSFTSGGVIVGLLLVKITGIEIFDPIFAIIISLNIIITGYKLIRESIGGLMLESDEEILEKITERLVMLRKPYWIDIHELRYFQIADKIYIDFHLVLPYYLTIKEAHEIEEQIRKELGVVFPRTEIKIHLDYCQPKMCEFCPFDECAHREGSRKRDIEWTLDKLISKPHWKKKG
jgi:cation diffusion facilitator family transporter